MIPSGNTGLSPVMSRQCTVLYPYAPWVFGTVVALSVLLAELKVRRAEPLCEACGLPRDVGGDAAPAHRSNGIV